MALSMTVSFLGTGSGVPTADRFFSSTLLHLQNQHLLVDAGEPSVHLLVDRGDLLREIGAVLITHGHVDHIGGLPALLQGCKLARRSSLLEIYLPEEMIAPLRAWIGALYLPEEGLGFPIKWIGWQNGVQVRLNKETIVTAHRNGHLDACYRDRLGADPSRSCDSYMLEIEVNDLRVIFSGDLASPNELKPLLDRPITLLTSELSHFTAEALAEALREVSIKTLCLVHLAEVYAEDRSGLRMRMEELLPKVKDVILPEDGTVLDF